MKACRQRLVETVRFATEKSKNVFFFLGGAAARRRAFASSTRRSSLAHALGDGSGELPPMFPSVKTPRSSRR
jgi:hypothetical protein